MRMCVAAMCGAALLVGSIARPAEAATQPRVTTRQFHGTATAQLTNGVNIAGCPAILSNSVAFTIDRPNRRSWNGSFQGCVAAPDPTQEFFSFSGPLTLVTARGVHLTGYGQFSASLHATGLLLTITGSDGEYVGGQLIVDLGGFDVLSGPVSGTIDVQRKPPGPRPFHATIPRLAYATVPDPSCQSGTAIVLTGSLHRAGIPDWTFSIYGCPAVPTAAMRITTGGGITLDGTLVSRRTSGTVLRFAFDLVRATREYSAGHLDLTIDLETPGAVATASGQFTTIS